MDRPDRANSPSLSEQRDRYRFLFENSPDPLLIMEGDRFTDCNRAAVHMFGFNDKSEIVDRHPSEVSPEYQPDGQLSAEKADEILARLADEPYQRFEWTHIRADGTRFPVEVSLLLLPGKGGPVLHTSLRDISDRKRLEQELRHSQRMEAIGKLAGGIAHDINNQLVPIKGYADLLMTRLADDTEIREWATEISRAAGMAAVVIRKLLTISRKEQGEMATVELGETVSSLLGMLAKLIGDDIKIEFRESPRPLRTRIGSGDIEQILLNLASNARDAMPQGGAITVALAHEPGPGGGIAHLRFSDDGPGMDDETLASIFEPFFTTKELGAGTGLGLSTVLELVDNAGGQVEVDSAPGRGTTFDLRLPVLHKDQESGGDTERPPKRRPAPPVRRGHVLVVEDSELVSRFAEEILELRGHRVTIANDAQDGLRLIAEDRPDLVLSDVIMPGISGPQMIEKLEATGVHIPVVFMSGYTDDRLAKLDFDASSVPLVRKPFSATQLIEAVEDALELSGQD